MTDLGLFTGIVAVIESLSQALLHFTWQAVLVATLLKVSLSVLPQSNFHQRYMLSVSALVILIAMPVFTFVLNYSVSAGLPPSTLLAESNLLFNSAGAEQLGAGDIGLNQNQGEWSLSSLVFELSKFDIVSIWFVGVLLALVKFCWDVHRTYQLANTNVEPVTPEIQIIVDRLIQKMKIKVGVRVFKSTQVLVPVVIGWIKPVVLLPVAVAAGLDREQLALILAHELAHIKRFDFLVNLLQGLAQVVFFFHPCVYWINKVIREEREFICDAAALEAMGDDEENRLNLAKALLNTAELKQGNYSLMAVAANGGHLKKRVYRIIASENKRLPSANSIVILIGALLFSLAAIASSVNVADEYTSPNLNTVSLLEAQKSSLDAEPASQAESKDTEMRSKTEQGLVETNSDLKTSELQNAGSESNLKRVLADSSESSASLSNRADYLKPSPKLKPSKKDSLSPINDVSELESKNITKSDRLSEVIVDEVNSDSLPEGINVSQLNEPKISKKKLHTSLKVHKKSEDIKLAKLFDEKNKQSSTKNGDLKNQRLKANEQSNQQSNILLAEELVAKPLFTLESFDIDSFSTALDANVDSNSAVKKGFREPKALSTPYPRYPAEAFDQKLTGQLKVNFTINKDGRVEDLEFDTDGPRIFVVEIKERLRRWRYEPAEQNGVKVSYPATMYFEFEVPENKPFYIRSTGSRIKRLASN